LISALTLPQGTNITPPANPTKQGFAFLGWHLDQQLLQPISIPQTMPGYSFSLYAKWAINSYTIEFQTNGGTPINPLILSSNELIQPFTQSTTKTEHNFVDWYLDDTLTIPFDFRFMPPYNLTLYAKWTINQYTITFNTNGGNSISSQTNNFGSLLVIPTPTRSGYSFIGWFTDSNLTQAAPTTMPAANITLYAKWTINQFTQGSSFSNAIIMSRFTSYTVSITSSGQLVYFRFTPTSSGTYTFSSSGSSDTFGTLYSASQTIIDSDDDSGTDLNFRISRSLTANTTYYLVARLYGSGTGSFTVSVT
jgi:uncharacterized repeat protein (TIGR02543 family)